MLVSLPAALANSGDGILLDNSAFNVVGTDGDGLNDAGERNVISGNALNGISIDGPRAANNIVAGNVIGTRASGAAALGNQGAGIVVFE